jgi:hypothetical protein
MWRSEILFHQKKFLQKIFLCRKVFLSTPSKTPQKIAERIKKIQLKTGKKFVWPAKFLEKLENLEKSHKKQTETGPTFEDNIKKQTETGPTFEENIKKQTETGPTYTEKNHQELLFENFLKFATRLFDKFCLLMKIVFWYYIFVCIIVYIIVLRLLYDFIKPQ